MHIYNLVCACLLCCCFQHSRTPHIWYVSTVEPLLMNIPKYEFSWLQSVLMGKYCL